MRLLIRLAVIAVAIVVAIPLTAPLIARAQWEEITVNTIKPANTSQSQCIGPSSSTCVRIETSGELNPQTANSDGYVFLPATAVCAGSTTNLTPTRVAANDWALARTATTVEAIHVTCSLNSWLQRMGGSQTAGGSRGVKITALKIHQAVVTQDILFATFNKLATVRRVNATANDVGANLASTVTMPTTAASTPYATAVAVSSAMFLPVIPDTDVNMDFSVELKNGTVYRLYGISVSFSKI